MVSALVLQTGAGSLAISVAGAPPSTDITDAFTGANGTDLAGRTTDTGQSYSVASGKFALDGSGQLKPVAGGTAYLDAPTGDLTVRIGINSSQQFFWPAASARGWGVADKGSGNGINLYKPDGTDLGGVAAASYGKHRITFAFRASDSTVRIFISDFEVYSGPDYYAGDPRVSLFAHPASDNSGARFDDLSIVEEYDPPADRTWTTVASYAQLGAAGLDFAPDGLLRSPSWDATKLLMAYGLAAGGKLITGTPSAPCGGTASTLLIQSMQESLPYKGAGPSLSVGGGNHVVCVHGEQHPNGEQLGFMGHIRMALYNGSTLTDMGRACQPNKVYAVPKTWPTFLDCGSFDPWDGGDGYIYSYITNFKNDGSSSVQPTQWSVCIARTLKSAFQTAAALGQNSTWYYYHDGAWTELALGGLSTPLEESNLPCNWISQALAADGTRVICAIDGRGDYPGSQILRMKSSDTAGLVFPTSSVTEMTPGGYGREGRWYPTVQSDGYFTYLYVADYNDIWSYVEVRRQPLGVTLA